MEKILRILALWDEGKTWCVRALVILAEYPGSVPSIYMEIHSCV